MPRRFLPAALAALSALCLSLPARAQSADPLTAPYPDSLCTYCTAWSEPAAPFRIHGDTYYVGTRGLSAVLIAGPEGHVLIDGALPNNAPALLAAVRSLGYDPADIVLLLNSHPHFDHAGGLAALQRATGARVAAVPASADVIARGAVGPDDPQFSMHLDFPAVPGVERFAAGDTLRVGPIAVASHATPGHTPGGTSWSWTACDGDDCRDIVYADSQTPVSDDAFRYADGDRYPGAVGDFARGLATLASLPCDVLVTTHPSATNLWERAADGADGLVDAAACARYADRARRAVADRLAREVDGRTYLCGTGDEALPFTLWAAPSGAALRMPDLFADGDRYAVLESVPAASGARYRQGDAEVWTHGDTARIVFDGVPLGDCRPAAAE